jgi:hypothetical protein
MQNHTNRPHRRLWAAFFVALASCGGCGKTVTRTATEQLLTSDAGDRAVARIDFSDLTGKKVFFDTQYVQNVKGPGFITADYIISSMRQQLIAADVLLQEKRDTNAAKRFFRRLLNHHDISEQIITDGLESYGAALREIPELTAVEHNTTQASPNCLLGRSGRKRLLSAAAGRF